MATYPAASREAPPAELFRPASGLHHAAEAITRPARGYWADAWARFRKNRMAVVGLIVLVLVGIMSIIGPHLTPYDYRQTSLLDTDLPPSAEHWFGTDELGRDIFTRLWYGARISLLIGILAASIDLVIGVAWGGIAGYFGGVVDDVMMRVVDVLYGIPYLLIVILLVVVVGPGLWSIVIAMGSVGWVGMARLVRGQVLQIKEQEYVLAARALGVRPLLIVWRHVLPNTMGVILVNITLTVPAAIFGEAFLSFIGLGVQDPLASLGSMIYSSYQVLRVYPHELFFPAAVLSLILLGFNFLGDGLRDALDPRERR
ncbi:MAG TPA: ABC transporter permease [Limnochordales bacterium]